MWFGSLGLKTTLKRAIVGEMMASNPEMLDKDCLIWEGFNFTTMTTNLVDVIRCNRRKLRLFFIKKAWFGSKLKGIKEAAKRVLGKHMRKEHESLGIELSAHNTPTRIMDVKGQRREPKMQLP